MRVGSLFTGVGGFDLGFEQAGMTIEWQCENNKQCQNLLKRRWPNTLLFEDITQDNDYTPVELICGGDPCPIRSKARSIWKTKIPDLSGYFLAVVARCQPRWVVRENVPASDDVDFITCLEMLGYRTVIISANAATLTAQNRERDFIVGYYPETFKAFIEAIPIHENDKRYAETKYQKIPAYPVLTTHSCRWDARDGYIWDGKGLRVADSQERRQLAGFPDGWFDIIPTENLVIKIIGREVDIWEWIQNHVALMVAKEQFVTGIHHCVSCIIKDGEKEALRINISDLKRNAKYAEILLKEMDFVVNTDPHTENMAILWLEKREKKHDLQTEKDIVKLCTTVNHDQDTKSLWNLYLVEDLNQKSLFTMSTWIKKMTKRKTCIYASQEATISKYTDLLRDLSSRLLNQTSSSLIIKAECMKSLSKTAVAKMTGNAVVPAIAQILGNIIKGISV